MRVCFVSSYPPNRARLSEYAENLVTELAKRSSIEKIYVIADKASSTETYSPKNPKIEVIRAWSTDKRSLSLNSLLSQETQTRCCTLQRSLPELRQEAAGQLCRFSFSSAFEAS
jgi:hypothetical protein